MRRALVLAVLALLTLASPAQAGWKINRSLQIAQIVWHPTCGQLRLQYGTPASTGARNETGAYASAWAWAGDCNIGIDASRHMGWEMLCTTVLHEGGHVDGLGHSTNPRSVMYPDRVIIHTVARIGHRTLERWDGADPRCRDRGRPYLERHGML